jgi:hypothetical protein
MTSTTVSVRGIARNVAWHEQRSAGGGDSSVYIFYLLNFQLEQTDNFGNIIKFSAIEFKSNNIQNVCVEGDEVEVTGILGKNSILYAEEIKNLKTSSILTREKSSNLLGNLLLIFAFFIIGSGFIGILSGFIKMHQIDQEKLEAERLKQEGEAKALELSQRFCVVTMRHNIVTLYETPNGQEISYVPIGSYIVNEYTLTETGLDRRWLQIEVEGRQGWIPDSAWGIARKSDLCP